MNEIRLHPRSTDRDPTAGTIVHEQSVQEIKQLLTDTVLPYAPVSPRVLLVGFGNRVEELVAIHDVLQPSHITAIDPGLTIHTKLKWVRHVLSQKIARQNSLFSTIKMNNTYVEDQHVMYDIVCCFSLSPMLQNDEDVSNLAMLSESLFVVTAHKDGGISFGNLSEPDHIDALIQNNLPNRCVISKRSLGGQTNDGHIWVVNTSTNV